MLPTLNRRAFLAASAAAGLGLAAAGPARGQPFKTQLKKALITKKITEDYLKSLKDAGFDGVETSDCAATPDETAACRAMAEKLGLRIHAVLRGWMQFNDKDPAVVAKSIAETEMALRAAKGYGADAILLVPCRIGAKGSTMKIPEAWEFDLEFDEKTGHLRRVVAGDNAPYAEYIAAHNHATDTSREAVRRLIPAAHENGVLIALENVWNNLWVKPAHFRQFVASFESPWIQSYYDIGNHVKYAPPEDWLRTLGSLVVRLHVKDFKLNEDGRGGSFVNIREGSVNWPLVRRTIEAVGYNGWMTIEGGNCSMEEHSKRLDLIIAGK